MYWTEHLFFGELAFVERWENYEMGKLGRIGGWKKELLYQGDYSPRRWDYFGLCGAHLVRSTFDRCKPFLSNLIPPQSSSMPNFTLIEAYPQLD